MRPNIKIDNQPLPYLSDINESIDSKKLYSDFLEQFKNIELIEIQFYDFRDDGDDYGNNDDEEDVEVEEDIKVKVKVKNVFQKKVNSTESIKEYIESIKEYIKIMINTFKNFEIIFSCTTLYSQYETFFNILMTSYNYNKITLYIKDNLNVNKQTGNASYVTQPYINKLKDHCIENNIEIQTNIGI